MKVLIFAATLFAMASAPKEEYRCTYTKKVECDESTGCTSTSIGSAYLLIPHPDSMVGATIRASLSREPLPEIRRCDNRGCTPFEVTAVSSGMFINVATVEGGYYLKLVRHGMDQVRTGMFVESATLFLATITYWGSCAIR